MNTNTVWGLLKAYVREFEIENNVKFGNTAWDRIKKLESDILAVMDVHRSFDKEPSSEVKHNESVASSGDERKP